MIEREKSNFTIQEFSRDTIIIYIKKIIYGNMEFTRYTGTYIIITINILHFFNLILPCEC